MSGETVVILGGYGLVGMQIARQIARHREPKKIVLASLFKHEADAAVAELSAEFPEPEIVGAHGNIFVRESFALLGRGELLADEGRVRQLYQDTFGALDAEDPENILNTCLMTRIIREHRPDILVDAVNTATGISYQDVKSSAHQVYKFHSSAAARIRSIDEALLDQAKSGDSAAVARLVETVSELRKDYLERIGEEDSRAGQSNELQVMIQLISQSVPQLVRHVVLLHKACNQVGTRVYLKIGTTGTGGMGLNIPYTHGEDRPSFKLMAKSSVGFAHSGLLFLLARTPGPTIYKEIKPASLIGYRKVDVRKVKRFGAEVPVATPESETLKGLQALDVRRSEGFESEQMLSLAGVDTGENGFFARGEFEAITYLGQMEFVTPQEIAERALHEISGRNTGKDVVQGLAGAVLDPSYRGGFLRPIAISDLVRMEEESGTPSVAIGQLGPPQLTKLLFETWLLGRVHGTVTEWVEDQSDDAALADKLVAVMREHGLDKTITSIGVPVRMPDGETILRGRQINVPESVERRVPIRKASEVERWTDQGWVDLRPSNVARWRARFNDAHKAQRRSSREGSSQFSRETYPYDELRTGEIVGWIFNHEPLLGEETVGGRLW